MTTKGCPACASRHLHRQARRAAATAGLRQVMACLLPALALVASLPRSAWATVPILSAEGLHRAVDRCSGPSPDECLAELEQAALGNAQGPVHHEGTVLELQTQAGPVRFDDRQQAIGHAPGYGSTERHRYIGRMAEVDAHWVLALPPGAPLEAARYWLVADAGPPVLALEDLPWPAPGGRLLALARAVAGPRPSVVALYTRAGNRWSLQYRYEAPSGLNYQFRSWRNDGAAVRLEWERTGAARACASLASSGSIQLRDGPYGWDLVAPVPASCP